MSVITRSWEEKQSGLIRAERRYWEDLSTTQLRAMEYWNYRWIDIEGQREQGELRNR